MFATKLEQYGEKLKREARKEGLERGLEKGREENALRVARRLLARGESVSDVAEITELSEERIRALRVEDDTP
jgi:predicted transposase/invertase (TIGR01784 family)